MVMRQWWYGAAARHQHKVGEEIDPARLQIRCVSGRLTDPLGACLIQSTWSGTYYLALLIFTFLRVINTQSDELLMEGSSARAYGVCIGHHPLATANQTAFIENVSWKVF